MTDSPPRQDKKRVGRPRKQPLSLGALERTSDRDIAIYRFVAAYMLAHPSSSKDAAIAAAEDKFRCSRSTVQRRIAPLEKLAPVLQTIEDILRRRNATPAATPDWTPYEGLTERLAVFYSADEVSELRTLSPPLALKLAQVREELQALRALPKRARKKAAR